MLDKEQEAMATLQATQEFPPSSGELEDVQASDASADATTYEVGVVHATGRDAFGDTFVVPLQSNADGTIGATPPAHQLLAPVVLRPIQLWRCARRVGCLQRGCAAVASAATCTPQEKVTTRTFTRPSRGRLQTCARPTADGPPQPAVPPHVRLLGPGTIESAFEQGQMHKPSRLQDVRLAGTQ